MTGKQNFPSDNASVTTVNLPGSQPRVPELMSDHEYNFGNDTVAHSVAL